MLASARNANLRALLAQDEEVRQTVLEMVTTMESIDHEERRGFRLANQLNPNLPDFMTNANPTSLQLETDTYNLVCELVSRKHPNQTLSLPKRAQFVDQVALRGVRYGTSRSPQQYRNSRVIYQDIGAVAQQAGSIQDIFEYSYLCTGDPEEKKSLFISVRHHMAHDRDLDPYPKFGFAGGFLCKATPDQLRILELPQIVSHFGLTKMRGKYEGYVHAMPMDFVSEAFCLPIFNTKCCLFEAHDIV